MAKQSLARLSRAMTTRWSTAVKAPTGKHPGFLVAAVRRFVALPLMATKRHASETIGQVTALSD